MQYFKNLLLVLFCLCCAILLKAQVSIVETVDVKMMMDQFIENNKSKQFLEGWRIQVLATNDRQKLEGSKQTLQYRYPNIPINWVHTSPYYKLRAGAFKTRLEAVRLKYILSKDYSGIYLVKDKSIRPREFIESY